MFCIKCGTNLPDNAKYCSSCGEKTDNFSSEPNNEERILMTGLCNRIKSPLFVQNGNAILTNKRLVYLKHNMAKVFTIGALVNLSKGSYDFDIPLKDISSIEDGRQGISKTIIIETLSGEKYNFYFAKREEWLIALKGAL